MGIKFYSGDYKERHLVHSGDVIVANTEQGHEFRLIGCPAIVPRHFGDTGIFSQHIYRVVPKETSYLSRDFLYFPVIEHGVREQIISATNGSTVNMLAIDGLQRPTFKLPPKSRVLAFTEIALENRQKRELNHDSICTPEKLRDTFLPKLMSGKVRVTVRLISTPTALGPEVEGTKGAPGASFLFGPLKNPHFKTAMTEAYTPRRVASRPQKKPAPTILGPAMDGQSLRLAY